MLLNKIKKCRTFAFTLAEVLITLTIIGIVAAVTLPALMNNANEHAVITKVEKAFNVLSQAYSRSLVDYPGPEFWDLKDATPEGAQNFFDVMSKYVLVAEDCGTNLQTNQPCFSDKPIYFVDGKKWGEKLSTTGAYLFTTQDGMSYVLVPRSSNCSRSIGEGKYENSCGYIMVDIDGPVKGKNTLGMDIFTFSLLKTGIVPSGGPKLTNENDGVKETAVVGNGSGAAWWILNKHNIDYISCHSKLNFTDKNSCKVANKK